MLGPPMVDDLFDAWEDAWSRRDPDAFAPLVVPGDFHYEDPLTPEPIEDPAALGRHAQRLWAGFPDVRVEKTGARLVDGRFAAAPAKLVGNHKAELEGLTPTGRFIVVHTVSYCEIKDGKLFRVRVFFDLYGAAVQLGVLPKPGTLGEKALLMLRGFGLQRKPAAGGDR